MSKEYVVYVIQHGFAIVEADSPEEARKQIEDDSRDLCWSKGIEVTSVEDNRRVDDPIEQWPCPGCKTLLFVRGTCHICGHP